MAFPWMFAGDLVGSGFNLVSTWLTNKTNERLTRETNANNRQMQREANETNIKIANEANALQREESEKAYRRSMPVNQVANMQAAGMSKAGALNTINGGGSYQPAAVNVGQVQASRDESPVYAAPQLDVGTLVNAIHADRQLKEQKRQFNATNELEKSRLEFEKQKWQDEQAARDQTFKNLVAAGEKLRAEAKKIGIETDIAETNKEILALTKEDKVNAENAESLARKVRAENQKYIEDVRAKGLKNIDEDTFKQLISSITEREAVATTLELFGLYLREKGSAAAGSVLKEFAKQSAIGGSPLTSINP